MVGLVYPRDAWLRDQLQATCRGKIFPDQIASRWTLLVGMGRQAAVVWVRQIEALRGGWPPGASSQAVLFALPLIRRYAPESMRLDRGHELWVSPDMPVGCGDGDSTGSPASAGRLAVSSIGPVRRLHNLQDGQACGTDRQPGPGSIGSARARPRIARPPQPAQTVGSRA